VCLPSLLIAGQHYPNHRKQQKGRKEIEVVRHEYAPSERCERIKWKHHILSANHYFMVTLPK
jgi:hypothetical protein